MTSQLVKRKKFASILIAILIAAIVLNISVIIYSLVIGNGFNNSLFSAAAVCFLIFIPIYLGKKNIEKELKNRAGN